MTTAITGTVIGVRDCGRLVLLFLDAGEGRVIPVLVDHRACIQLLEKKAGSLDRLIGRCVAWDGDLVWLIEGGIMSKRRRRARLAEINAEPATREAVEARYGKVWDTRELAAEFIIIGFMAPYVVVQRKVDGVKGSLEFQHLPRFYFGFRPDE